MGACRVQAILKTDSGLPEDWITNSWCFDGTDPFADRTAVETAMIAFYNNLVPLVLSDWVTQLGHQFKWYDLPGVTPNYPIAETTWNLSTNPTGVSLPYECSMVLSFQGQRVPGFPQARRRGRLYIGTIVGPPTALSRPSAAQINTLANGAGNFKTAIDAIASDTQWAVWSTVDQAAVAIDNGWVDNAWDTQRRRGNLSTSRTTFS